MRLVISLVAVCRGSSISAPTWIRPIEPLTRIAWNEASDPVYDSSPRLGQLNHVFAWEILSMQGPLVLPHVWPARHLAQHEDINKRPGVA